MCCCDLSRANGPVFDQIFSLCSYVSTELLYAWNCVPVRMGGTAHWMIDCNFFSSSFSSLFFFYSSNGICIAHPKFGLSVSGENENEEIFIYLYTYECDSLLRERE